MEVVNLLNGNINISFISLENDLEYISEFLGIKATKIVHRGDQVTSKRVSQKNIWIYSIKFDSTNYNEEIIKFLDLFINKSEMIEQLKKANTVVLTLQIRSEYGQIGLSLDKTIINLIAVLGLNLEVDILSFGAVKE